MPLPAATSRRELHLRTVECRGFEREDGLFDVDARVTDRRRYALKRPDGRIAPADEPIHDMWIRLTVDADLRIRDILAVTDSSPHAICVAAPMAMRRLIGERIGAGFTRRTRELLGGAQGCTHLMELLGPAATTAFQSLAHLRFAAPDQLDAKGRPTKIDSCFAYAADGPVVKERWPRHYTGDKA
jgi:hypothetical protein